MLKNDIPRLSAKLKDNNITENQIVEVLKALRDSDFEAYTSYINEIRRELRICCFSSNNKSILMWSHYANQHKGICIKYRFSTAERTLSDRIYPVMYMNKLPDITNNFSHMHNLFELCSLIKSTVWRYENEWRFSMLFDEKDAPNEMKTPIPEAIYLGACIEDNFKSIIESFAKTQKIKLYQMKMDRQRFKLIPRKVKLN